MAKIEKSRFNELYASFKSITGIPAVLPSQGQIDAWSRNFRTQSEVAEIDAAPESKKAEVKARTGVTEEERDRIVSLFEIQGKLVAHRQLPMDERKLDRANYKAMQATRRKLMATDG